MVESIKTDGKVIVEIKGVDKLTVAVAADVKDELTKIVSSNTEPFILNLGNIKFIDSTGIGILISALKVARERNLKLVLSNIQPDVMNLLQLMKLDKVFNIKED